MHDLTALPAAAATVYKHNLSALAVKHYNNYNIVINYEHANLRKYVVT